MVSIESVPKAAKRIYETLEGWGGKSPLPLVNLESLLMRRKRKSKRQLAEQILSEAYSGSQGSPPLANPDEDYLDDVETLAEQIY